MDEIEEDFPDELEEEEVDVEQEFLDIKHQQYSLISQSYLDIIESGEMLKIYNPQKQALWVVKDLSNGLYGYKLFDVSGYFYKVTMPPNSYAFFHFTIRNFVILGFRTLDIIKENLGTAGNG